MLSELLISVPPDAELLGLVGRINKDLAWRSADAEKGRAHLQSALAFYFDGYCRDGKLPLPRPQHPVWHARKTRRHRLGRSRRIGQRRDADHSKPAQCAVGYL